MRKIVFAWTMALLAVAIQAQDHAAAEAALKAQQYEKAAAAYQKITVANTALLELAGLEQRLVVFGQLQRITPFRRNRWFWLAGTVPGDKVHNSPSM